MIKHKLDLRYEGAELGVGSVLKRNDENIYSKVAHYSVKE